MKNMGKRNDGPITHHSDKEGNATPEIVIINCVLNAPLMLISILCNALVLAAIIRTPSIRSTHMIMLCSLAVSDLLVGLIAQPIYIAHQLTDDRGVAYHLWRLLGPSLCIVSLLTITAITVDRFLALHYHMRYATLVTESRVKYTLISIWLISILISVFHVWNELVYQFALGSVTAISLAFSTFSYIRIYRIVRRHQLNINAQQQAMQSSNAGNNLNIHVARFKRSAINTFVFYIALIICYLPMCVLLTFFGLSYKFWPKEWEYATTLVFFNSCINPFLYCWRLRELRTAVVKTARKMLCKETGEN